jgi:hypothetical protein
MDRCNHCKLLLVLRTDKTVRSLLTAESVLVTDCIAKLWAAVRGDSSEVRALCEIIGVI